eukprot:9494164-Pyramimonas_sp.AAC.1
MRGEPAGLSSALARDEILPADYSCICVHYSSYLLQGIPTLFCTPASVMAVPEHIRGTTSLLVVWVGNNGSVTMTHICPHPTRRP